MANQRRAQHRRPAATPLAALCAALFVVLALVAPVLANDGSTGLFDADVSPRTGTTATTIAFTVTYRNHEGSPAEHVSVLVDGVVHPMTSDGSANWKTGVVHHWSTKLAAGTHAVSFEAAGRDKFSNTLAGGTVTITVPPTPTPAPTPDATPMPTPKPTPKPTPTPKPAETPAPTSPGGSGDGSVPGGTSSGDPTPTPGGGAGGTGGPGDTPTDPGATPGPDGGTGGAGGPGGGDTTNGGDTPGGAGGTGEWSDGSGDGAGRSTSSIDAGGTGLAASGPITGAGDVPTTPVSADATDARGAGRIVVTGGPGWGAFASALTALGIDRPPTLTNVPMLVGTSTAMTIAFAFAIFGKKRRDEGPPAPDEVLQANAARGHGGAPSSEILNSVVRAATIAPPLDLEAGMPRWRRPSLLEARKADPTRSIASPHRMSFDSGVVGAVEGRECRVVRYAVVRLLDAPDELRSAEIGQLDQGDEVQLIERSGSYWLVLCPDGRQGWLHKMTLGEIVSDAVPAAFGRDIDDDVLAAFLTARAHA